jgi:peptidoglycan/LPS O-acetylase OafA/YrhL
VLPTSCLDSLGAGALLALPSARRSMMTAGWLIGIPLLAASLWLRYAGYAGIALEVALDFGVSLAAAWMVGRAAAGVTGAAGSMLIARPVVYVGTISYGLYLYHGFMPYVLGRYVPGFIEMSWPIRFVLLTMTTVATAAVSWKMFEAPILSLKDRLAGASQETMHDVRVHAAQRRVVEGLR